MVNQLYVFSPCKSTGRRNNLRVCKSFFGNLFKNFQKIFSERIICFFELYIYSVKFGRTVSGLFKSAVPVMRLFRFAEQNRGKRFGRTVSGLLKSAVSVIRLFRFAGQNSGKRVEKRKS
jgi:hypothetical protein